MYDTDEELVKLYAAVSNAGRWGKEDKIGTLNYITDGKRREAAQLVKLGKAISISRPVDTAVSARNLMASVHYMLYEQVDPISALDFIGMPVHTFSNTHIDSTVHVNWEGTCYNGRKIADILSPKGLSWGGIDNQRDGLFTRGVFLDICAVRGVEYLDRKEYVYAEDIEKAEKLAKVSIEPGDCLFVHVGLHRREQKEGTINPAEGLAGIHAEVLPYLHAKKVAVWSGDCVERMPYPSARFPLPMHMIGLASMGLVQLDIPDMEYLWSTCRNLDRSTFLLTAAPLYIQGGSGSPINPICVF